MKHSILAFSLGVLATSVFFLIFHLLSPNKNSKFITSTGVDVSVCMNPNNEVLQLTCPQFCNDRPDLLPPPAFAKSMPQEIKPDLDNGIMVKWEPVKDALRYRVILLDKKGERIKSLSTAMNHLYLPNLPKSDKGQVVEFLVSVVSIDKNEQEGKPSERRTVIVKSGDPLVQAPKIKVIKVED